MSELISQPLLPSLKRSSFSDELDETHILA